MFEKNPQIITAIVKKRYTGKAGYHGFSVQGSKTEEFTSSSGVLFNIPKGKCTPYLDPYGRYVTICCDEKGKSCNVEKLLDSCQTT